MRPARIRVRKMTKFLFSTFCVCILFFSVHGQELTPKKDINEKWGFVDKTGKVVIPFKYDGVTDFSEGLAAVMIGNKCGFIDRTGEVVIPLEYENVTPFIYELTLVKLNNLWGCIDKTGKVIIPIIYTEQEAGYRGQVYLTNKMQKLTEEETMEEFKRCPYCGEEILSVAIKCKHCGEWLDKTTTSKVEFKPKKGSFCIEVQFRPLGDIVIQSNPIGLASAGISAKCFVAKKSELRIDLLFGFSSNKGTSATTFGLNFGLNRHFNGTERISPYIGFLLGFGVRNMKSDDQDSMKDLGMQIIVPTGFNWYVVNGLYIGAEIGLGLGFNKDLKEKTKASFGINFFATPAIRLGWKF